MFYSVVMILLTISYLYALVLFADKTHKRKTELGR